MLRESARNMSSFIPDSKARLVDTDIEMEFLSAPEHADAITLHEYWLGKRGGRPFPDRSDISPSDFSRLLPNILIVEVLEGGRDFRFRLYGSSMVAMTGLDRTGEYFSKLEAAPGAKISSEETRQYWMNYGAQLIGAQGPIFTRIPLVPGVGPRSMLHSVVLPLTAGGTEIGQVMAGAFIAAPERTQA